jgi:hypothetical protein
MMCVPWSGPICYTHKWTSAPGAQTKRQGDAGPVSALLGGLTSPATFIVLLNESFPGATANAGQGATGDALPSPSPPTDALGVSDRSAQDYVVG